MPAPRVAILLSTYNGSAYLDVQLDSIARQDWADWHVIARDDGSSDDTIAILERWSSRVRLTVRRGTHVGARDSFLDLLYNVPEHDLIAFADQDDVWHRDKISRAIEVLADISADIPAMYCGRVRIVDQNLTLLGLSPNPRLSPRFENALVENIAPGCTTVLNRTARTLLTSAPHPQHALMHDWWCYLVVSAFGHVVFDATPRIDYRQHPRNAVGTEAIAWRRLANKVRRHIRAHSYEPLFEQAIDFHARYADRLDPSGRRTLDEFIGFHSPRLHLDALTSRAFRRQSRLDQLVLRATLALPWLRSGTERPPAAG